MLCKYALYEKSYTSSSYLRNAVVCDLIWSEGKLNPKEMQIANLPLN